VIYFIQQGHDGPIKIGLAETERDCEHRLRLLQVGNPQRLRLLAVMGGRMDCDKALHAVFVRGRIRGEWVQGGTRVCRI
jgi:hypothetical protein